MQPFRFGAMLGRAATRGEWLDQVRRAEDLGYSTVFVSDHFSDKLAPLPALAMAAEHTALRVGTLVLANDFRHPAALAKEAATVDLLSEGRLELGIGTGWQEEDYAAAGIARPSAAEQVERLEEAVRVLKGLWRPGRFDMDGAHYRVHLDGKPEPGEGRPTLLIGGGGRRLLGIAAREADIVGISTGEIATRADLADKLVRAGDRVDDKVEWIKAAAGERYERLEFNIVTFGAEIGDRSRGAARLAERWSCRPEQILASPHFLAGSPAEIARDLTERRERWGLNYTVIQAGDMEDFAPVIPLL